ncbi:hypothetical protein ANOM_003883 [Aspergillus nomiae NRRL 13137]|uniref:Uncharacterized protein n=1 Tax=Aspergillus nomiae NRRL (strain ATCC 15546 / NRRL 13137 / CBS 260.88 / M93) TaxID=1509407 RepID=A0A0L1J7Y1_ASPN3|nr:uncharacterized protein ANOM_003883 [Aspergillus nomiae NRRL 13137]KNG87859.1 hypothetical protein ANOM_003883 [Aspergillus nomiae NRRL 13137]
MPPINAPLVDIDPSRINIIREIVQSDASSIFEAYEKLFTSGVCERRFVPNFYGYINEMDPDAFHPTLQGFAKDKLKPSAILLEYLPDTESLNCVNYSDTLYSQAIEGMKADTQLVWIDFDVATTFTNFGSEQKALCDHEIALVKGLGDALKDDQDNGLPPNTKFY